ncbi:MAG: family 78 glycoside hydrolase catalytic domain [Clostridia bacterium]|nr:family 78 glycoside hydrolase catalytic domain [Clostridia bacterium]
MREWTAKWIGADMTVKDRFAPIFKKEFTVTKEIRKAEIMICGLGLFELKINGTLPDDTVLNPAHTQYSQTVLYRVFDITDLLCENNIITVELGNSFLNEETDVWDWDTATWRSAPKLIAQLDIEYSDGTLERIATDEAWLVTLDGPTVANSIYLGETYDARRTDFSWQNAIEVTPPAGKLKLQDMPPIRRICTCAAKEIVRHECGIYIITAPEMMTGWAKIRIDAPKDTAVYITYGEKLTAEGRVQKIGNGEGHGWEWWPENYIQHDCFISNGEPFEFEPRFSYKGYKYIEIENLDKLEKEDVTLYKTANDVEIIGSFECSDEMLNKLHHIMVSTLLNNFQGKPTDTPVWEKNGWLGDANCALPIMMYNFDMSKYMASFIDIMNDCFNEYGSVPVIVPSASWSIENSPVWNTIYVFGAEAMLDHCGDKEYVEKLYPNLKAFAEKDIAQLKELGWTWGTRGLSDWVSPSGGEDMEVLPDPSEGAEICCTAFIYAMLESMIRICEKLGINDDIAEYKAAADEIYKAFNEKFYNPDNGIYETTIWKEMGIRTKYRQTSNLLPLYFGMVPEESREKVIKNLVDDFISRDYHLDTGCTGTRFVLPVLFDCGFADVAMKVLLQKTYPSWGHWLENGTDSAWESWERTTRSKNHYFLATYDEIFFTHLAGLKNICDGWKSFTVEPVLDCGLEFVNASVKTPLGTAGCSWKKTDSGFTVEVTVPEGAQAKIRLSDKIDVIQNGGRKIYNI